MRDDRLQRGGHVRAQVGQKGNRSGLYRHLPGKGIFGLCDLKRATASQHLVQDHADSPDIRLPIRLLLRVEVFRCHIGIGSCPAGERVRSQDFSEAEIHELDDAVACQENIGGLDVAMDRTETVCVSQAIANLCGDMDSLRQGKLRGVPKDILEVTAPDILHVDDDFAADLVNTVHLDDVRVAQPVQHPGFFQESVLLLALGRDLLQRNLLTQQGVFRQVNNARRSMPKHV